MEPIPFNRPYLVGTETGYIEDAVRGGWLASGGEFGKRCEREIAERTGSVRALVTNSATAGLEAAALVAGLGPGDEVIMPSYTFVTTASSVALRGATPVFADIEPETLNLSPAAVEAAITPRTKAIVPVHYAGVACEMDALLELAEGRDLAVIEDAAQGLMSTYKGRPLGALGDLGAISFHETKNVTCGEGGALLVGDEELRERAEVVWGKGTNRARFDRGEIDKYSWVDLGSSFGLGEVSAAFLWGQLERVEEITARRMAIWDRYHAAFAELEDAGALRRPIVPGDRTHNAHMYYVLLPDRASRDRLLADLSARDILAVFHYVPLHSSPAGARTGRAAGPLPITDDVAGRIARLPLWTGMEAGTTDRVIEAVTDSVGAAAGGRR